MLNIYWSTKIRGDKMSSQVCVISINVPNLNEAIDFYTHTLGFEVNKQYGPKIVSLVHGAFYSINHCFTALSISFCKSFTFPASC